VGPDDLDERLAATGHLDVVRARDFDRLDRNGHVYLDHTGAGLHPQSLVDGHAELLRGAVFGNPHSVNPTSRPMTELVESARAAVLRHAGADPGEYTCIFTANASAAL
jgi:selenocysteine lyase/cysteine desulfurase